MMNITDFISTDITFQGIEAGYFIEVESYFKTLSNRNKPKYNVFMACAHVGLKLNDKERRETVEAEKQVEKKYDEYAKKTYNIPRTVLLQETMNVKRLLFIIATVVNKDDLEPTYLQSVWNSPSISKNESPVAVAIYRFALQGALYLLVKFQVDKLNADQVNEEMFDILSRDIGKIKLHKNISSDVQHTEVNMSKIDENAELGLNNTSNELLEE